MHGGGFTYGSKTSTGDPGGIIARSILADSEGVIFISITDVSKLAALDTKTLQSVNFEVVTRASQGLFIYGPALDGTYVPTLPQVLLAEGKYHLGINVVVGHNSYEAVPFLPIQHINRSRPHPHAGGRISRYISVNSGLRS